MTTSSQAHSAADSFDIGSITRFATGANSTRSTAAVNPRSATAFSIAAATPSSRHSSSNNHVTPTGRASTTFILRPGFRSSWAHGEDR